jgi:hypothetical protein
MAASRSPFSKAMQAFEDADAERQRLVVTHYLMGMITPQNRVRFKTLAEFHKYTTEDHPFKRVDNQPEPTREGSRQIFYQHGNIQVRVKTDGTKFRPRPHLVVTLAVGKGWDDEIGKFGKDGRLIPKIGFVGFNMETGRSTPGRLAANNDWRTLSRLGDSLEAIIKREDQWANACHFDFVDGFDATGAETL